MKRTAQNSENSLSPWWSQPIIYWQANQVVITFQSPVHVNRTNRANWAENAISSLSLGGLDQFLAAHGFHLSSFTSDDVPVERKTVPKRKDREEIEPAGEELPAKGLDSTVGKYLFAPSAGQGTLVVSFFHVTNPSLAITSSRYGYDKGGSTNIDTTQALVTLLNHNLDTLRHDGNIPIVAAMPNWFGGGTGGISASCPADPPIPVTGNNTDYKNWHFTLPQLLPALRELDGDSTTVFVLDTIPAAKDIKEAAQHSTNKNVLLKSFAALIGSQIAIHHTALPSSLAGIQAGKDLHGNMYGFEMPDHGLFVAGIIHDLVPRAKIECVRVLNDSGVGDVSTLCQALQAIQERMAQENLGQVVVNLSLEIMPPDEYLPGIWFGNDHCFHAQDLVAVSQDLHYLHIGLHMIIKSLATQGAIIVAASGNESNTNNHPPQRFGPRRPAAFHEVIAVGAVDQHGQAATYSDYPCLPPEHHGVATYGGAIPQALPYPQPQEPPGAKTWANVQDAVIGLYSSAAYPMLMATDEPPDGYSAPAGSHGWAYWSGTSFATPIISALAARILQAQQQGILPADTSVMDLITTGTGQQLLTGGAALPNNTGFGFGIGLLQAVQNHQ
jgi:subtilisin family serine protease